MTHLATSLLTPGVIVASAALQSNGSLMDTFADGGIMMYPISFCALMVVGLSARAGVRLYRRHAGPEVILRYTSDGVLFWGGFALILGILGTVVGIAIMAQAVELSGRAPTAIIWGGFRVSLITTIYGLLVLLIAALLWFALRQQDRRRLLGTG